KEQAVPRREQLPVGPDQALPGGRLRARIAVIAVDAISVEYASGYGWAVTGQRDEGGYKDYKGRMLHKYGYEDPGRGQGLSKHPVRCRFLPVGRRARCT